MLNCTKVTVIAPVNCNQFVCRHGRKLRHSINSINALRHCLFVYIWIDLDIRHEQIKKLPGKSTHWTYHTCTVIVSDQTLRVSMGSSYAVEKIQTLKEIQTETETEKRWCLNQYHEIPISHFHFRATTLSCFNISQVYDLWWTSVAIPC